MDFQLPLSPPSFGFESHCQMELRFLPSVTHQKDNYLPSMTALMQDYSEKQRSGCLKKQISEPDHHPELPPQAEPRPGTGSSPEHFSGHRRRDWGSNAVKS